MMVMPTARELFAFLIGVQVGQFGSHFFRIDPSLGSLTDPDVLRQAAASSSLVAPPLSASQSSPRSTTVRRKTESSTVSSTVSSSSNDSNSRQNTDDGSTSPWSWVWDVVPLQHTGHRAFANQSEFVVDAYTPFHAYFETLLDDASFPSQTTPPPPPPIDFPTLPKSHWWLHYAEAYHNHLYRFRGASRVVVMEVGVRSGGKIAMLRNYLGPGLVYVGVDINPITQPVLDTEDWIHIETGDSGDAQFLQRLIRKYPRVDIFIDDGGHHMHQQMLTLRYMLPHVHPEGVYLCEDLATSWWFSHGGTFGQSVYTAGNEFLHHTTVGLLHRMLDWFQANWVSGRSHPSESVTTAERRGTGHEHLDPELFPEDEWWQTVPRQVKHIHYYNQLVVFEKGLTHSPVDMATVGTLLYRSSIIFQKAVYNTSTFPPFDWPPILAQLARITQSPYYYDSGA